MTANPVTWAIIALWTAISLTSVFLPETLTGNTARYINVVLLSAFTLLHGARTYGARNIAVYFAIGVVVTNVFENLSIVTGFPFGQYYHTANMGPQLWHVPLIVGPIFAVAGYLAWMLAGILLGHVFRSGHTPGIARPLIAAFITTSWDVCVDAIGGTLNRDWVWADGGAWFGVPWLNFFGWMLTMWVIFQLFDRWLARGATVRAIAPADGYWMQPIVYWLLIGLQFPLVAVIMPSLALTDPAGGVWQAQDLATSMAIAATFTMIFTAVLAGFVLGDRRRGDI